MKRALVAGAVLAASTLLAPDATADPPPLLGLFEGHGIAPPADPARARAAIATAQRIHNACSELYQMRGGGTATAQGSCGQRKRWLSSLGRDAAAALLDVLDEPRRPEPHGLDSFGALVDALAGTGREDVVPLLITALERMELRATLHDSRVSEFGWRDHSSIDDALARLTYLERYERPWSLSSTSDPVAPAIAGWRAWWQENKGKPRATWKADSLSRAREKIAKRSGESAVEPALVLAEHAETKREGIAALKRLVRSAACADRCDNARYFLTRLEPRGGWGLPGM